MRTFITWISVLCIPAIGLWIVPQWKEVGSKEQSITNLEKSLTQKEERLENIIKTSNNIDTSNLADLKLKIPQGLQQENLIDQIYAIFNQKGYFFDGLDFSLEKSKQAEKLNIKLNAQGPKDKLPSLLEAIEKAPRFLGLENFQFKSGKESNSLQISFDLYAFFQ